MHPHPRHSRPSEFRLGFPENMIIRFIRQALNTNTEGESVKDPLVAWRICFWYIHRSSKALRLNALFTHHNYRKQPEVFYISLGPNLCHGVGKPLGDVFSFHLQRTRVVFMFHPTTLTENDWHLGCCSVRRTQACFTLNKNRTVFHWYPFHSSSPADSSPNHPRTLAS